ncbi:competence type IV pilus minor pilin ComGF [Bacillus sp. Cr_A10]|uniref:competence type IV pilus minor pilin ComGF n=1 Tax=Bacillus sp. Cr_A10 TaxID=3033993 RepID=UPI0023DA5721|nr:competence type IV pilus minor pilin ComGF [Bacillus sp. Cr_A10]MDF2066346.1 competence type IV pilus minor pilin ComGF [Bacillus sp. Cr_A10]
MPTYNILNKNNEEGYTLIESVFQLSVLLIFSHIFAVTIGWLSLMEVQVTNPTETEWALFIEDVENYLNDLDMIMVQTRNTGIRFIKEEVEFDIEIYQNLIRKQKNRLGHEQMLLHVKSINVSMEGQLLYFSVKFENGIDKEHTFYVTYNSE